MPPIEFGDAAVLFEDLGLFASAEEAAQLRVHDNASINGRVATLPHCPRSGGLSTEYRDLHVRQRRGIAQGGAQMCTGVLTCAALAPGCVMRMLEELSHDRV